MKLVLTASILVRFFTSFLPAAEVWSLERTTSPFEKSLQRLNFDAVDFSALRFQIGKRGKTLSESESNRLLERNLAHIFHNCLNRGRFLVAPEPQAVVDRITGIYETRNKVQRLLSESRSCYARKELSGRLAGLVEEVRRAATALKEDFSAFFVEAHDSAYSIRFPVAGGDQAQLAAFLVESKRITIQLTSQLDFYFLNSSPGAISLSDYRKTSIVVLSEALQKLADLVEQSLRHRRAAKATR